MLVTDAADEVGNELVDQAKSASELARYVQHDESVRLQIKTVERVQIAGRHDQEPARRKRPDARRPRLNVEHRSFAEPVPGAERRQACFAPCLQGLEHL